MTRYLLLSFVSLLSLVVSGQDLYSFQDSHGKFGLKDQNDKVIVAPRYDKIGNFQEGMAAVNIGGAEEERYENTFMGGLWGYINAAGKEVIPVQYTDTHEFSEGLAPVEQNGKWGYIDKTGKTLIPFQYEGAYIFGEGLASVSLANDIWGAINKKGIMVIKPAYTTLFSFYGGKAQVRIGLDQFKIDKTGKRVK